MTAAPSVLVVDDREDNLVAMRALLDQLDCDVVTASSGEAALRHLLAHDVAVILLDVQMPGIDGYETARHIKARSRTSAIPIIFLSAIDRALEHQLRGYEAGAVDFIPKPFIPEVLLSKVQVFLELHRSALTIEGQRRQLADRLHELEAAQAELSRQAIELLRSNAELARFTTAASEQLLEPLHAARGFLDLLAAGGEDGAPLLERAQHGVSRTIDVVRALDAYAKVTTAPLDDLAVDLDDCLDAAKKELADELLDASARVTADPLPTVRGDAWQLRQVFVELLSNAAGAARPDGVDVHIQVSRRDGDWLLGVHDDGRGMAGDPNRAFALFARSDPGPDDRGAGVGLAICRRVVERHGGTIWAAARPGGGTSVSLTLPVGERGE